QELGLRARRAQPRDARALKAADLVERQHERSRPDEAGQTTQRVEPNRRLSADEGECEMDQVGQGRTAAAFEGDLSRQPPEQCPSWRVRPEREEETARLVLGAVGHGATIKQTARHPWAPRRSR